VKAEVPGFKPEIAEIVVLDTKASNLELTVQPGKNINTIEVTTEAPEAEESKVSAALVEAEAMPLESAKSAAIVARRETHTTESRAKKSQSKTASAGSSEIQQAQWSVTGNGVLQRSLDSGTTWQDVAVGNGSGFRAVFSSGAEVWAGGKTGLLYHSTDSGHSWNQITPTANGQILQVDIVAIDFSDLRNGTLKTANGETWITADRGQTWRKQ
jgi:photosystem II stability/assembly factor-like uncharacterized protein